MKIKQTTFYALQAIRKIYLEEQRIVTSKAIADQEGMSQGVLLKQLRTLANSGILCAHQGRGAVCGGFSLIKSIDDITLLDVIDVMEHVDICANLDEEKDSHLFHSCYRINDSLREEFSKYTIRDLYGL